MEFGIPVWITYYDHKAECRMLCGPCPTWEVFDEVKQALRDSGCSDVSSIRAPENPRPSWKLFSPEEVI